MRRWAPDRRRQGFTAARMDRALTRSIAPSMQSLKDAAACHRAISGSLEFSAAQGLVQARLEARCVIGVAGLRQRPLRLGDELIVGAAGRRPRQIIGQGAERHQELAFDSRLRPGDDLIEIGDDDVDVRIAAGAEIGGAPVECRGIVVAARRPHDIAPVDQALGRCRVLGIGCLEFRNRLGQLLQLGGLPGGHGQHAGFVRRCAAIIHCR